MTKLYCVIGTVQTFQSVEDMLAHYGKNYAIRNGDELWHKGHNVMAGRIVEAAE